MTMLVRLPNWLGDTLLALPAIVGLGRHVGSGLMVAGRRLPLALARQVLRDACGLELSRSGDPVGFLREARMARRHLPAQGVLLTPSFSSALWLRLSGCPKRIGWGGNGRGLLLTHPRERAPRGADHLGAEFIDLARMAGAHSFPPLPYLPRSEEASRTARDWLDRQVGLRDDPAFVALIPGARFGPAKRWPVGSFALLAQRLAREGVRGVVIGTADERSEAGAIAGAGGAGWASAAGVGSVFFSAELLRGAAVAVGNDSGGVHLAAAVGTPCVALFGSTDPRWTAPQGAGHLIVSAECECAPCFRRTCPLGNPAPCLQNIPPDLIFDRVRFVLAQRGPRDSDPAARPWAVGGTEERAEDRGGSAAPALFLDRDGTLLALVEYLRDPEEVRFEEGAVGALRRAADTGFRLIVVTNQSGIGRGLFSRAAVDGIHARVRERLAAAGVHIDRFLICPHHPEFTGPCSCRKPEPGLLLAAARDLDIDLGRSYMVGDTVEDLLAGCRAGCVPVLVRTGYGARQADERRGEIPPQALQADNLAGAVALILSQGGMGGSLGAERCGPEGQI